MDSAVVELRNKLFDAAMRIGDNPRAQGEGQQLYLTETEINLLYSIIDARLTKARR